MNETAWDAIERDEARPVPTAPVGKSVQWYVGGDIRFPVAGIVQGIEGPGRLKLKVFPLNAMPQEKTGVYHVNSSVHDRPNNPTTTRSGSWDFVPGEAVDKAYFKPFEEEVQKRKDNLMRAEEAAKKAEEDFKRRRKEMAEGKRKKPDILPANAG